MKKNNKRITALACAGALGLLSLSAPLLSRDASAFAIIEQAPPLESYDTSTWNISLMGYCTVSMLYDNNVNKEIVTYNPQLVYDEYSSLETQQLLLAGNNYITEKQDGSLIFSWYESWLDDGSNYLWLNFNDFYAPITQRNDVIADTIVTYTGAFRDSVKDIVLVGEFFDITTQEWVYNEYTFTTSDSWSPISYLLGSFVDEYYNYYYTDAYNYVYFRYLDMYFIAPETTTDDALAVKFQPVQLDIVSQYDEYISNRRYYQDNFVDLRIKEVDVDNAFGFTLDVVESFLAVEFLPNLSFGDLLIIVIACAMLGIGLKIAFGG